ncbi:MAG TPA: DNA alkylation repair protein [Kineosporiaceae bacterium]|nr:DNA alkylation repair protein [Kineosporiaceae bacterium]
MDVGVGAGADDVDAAAAASVAVERIRQELAALADPVRAEGGRRYLQLMPGGYGEGDDLLGVPVPDQRRIAARHWRDLDLTGACTLLSDGMHEERLTALFVLVRRFRSGGAAARKAIFELVTGERARIDNWDLVDSVAPHVVGGWLTDPRGAADLPVLDRLAGSASVWHRRMAVVATLAFIRRGEYGPTLRLSARLLDDPHDLVHKAVGWMLREVGNRDRAVEENFLRRHHDRMPRIALRYAIEKFEPALRRRYLTGDLPAAR